jgi:ferredoxin-NADP reductase
MAEVRTAIITDARQLSPHVRELTLLPDGDPVDYQPGQWLSLRLPVGDRPPLVRAYSMANAPTPDGSLVLTFDHVPDGLGTGYLWDIETGTSVEFTGPMGNFILPDGDPPLLLLARYTGIVPFRAMLESLARRAENSETVRSVHLIYSAPSPEERVYHNGLTDLTARAPWLDYHPASEGDEIALLDAVAADWMPFTPLVCGIREFNLTMRGYLMERFGFDRRAVKIENFS